MMAGQWFQKREVFFMTFREILEADITRYEQNNHNLSSLEPVKDESAKTKVDFRLKLQLGEVLMKIFPELQCFQPQLNAAANDVEFKPFEEFLAEISQSKSCQKALKKMVEDKLAIQTPNISRSNG